MPAEDDVDEQLPMLFEDRFLDRHAGAIVSDPLIAIVELIANAWDAGARRVAITWPTEATPFQIEDDGTGMSPSEFRSTWTKLDYNRRANHGPWVEFPPGVQLPKRPVFGRNGRGRHAALNFGRSYIVTTTKDGVRSKWRVERGRDAPLVATALETDQHGISGTIVTSVDPTTPGLSAKDVRVEVGLRFLTDPNFEVILDGVRVDFDHLPESHVTRYELNVEGVGNVTLLMVDVQQTDRTSKQHGIAWRVGPRLVGECSWRGFDDQALLDGRSRAAKRYTFIVFADVVEDAVLPDWSGFDTKHATWKAVSSVVHGHIRKVLTDLTAEDRAEAGEQVRQRHHSAVNKLTPVKREIWNQFVDQVLEKCPSVSVRQVEDLAGILANLELSASQYGLIAKLGEMNPNDLDSLHRILDDWTLGMAKVVLDEVAGRLVLVNQLREKVRDTRAHEVQELQPLFKQGLWIFGPEFETIEFTSNEGMTTVIQKLFGAGRNDKGSLNRPDFVVLPDATSGFYAVPRFDSEYAEAGVSSLVIIELKRPGIPIGTEQKDQAYKYVKELLKLGYIDGQTRVRCFVLGDSLDQDDPEPRKERGEQVIITPMTYETVLSRAHSRMFRLYERVKAAPFLAPEQRKEWSEFVEGSGPRQGLLL